MIVPDRAADSYLPRLRHRLRWPGGHRSLSHGLAALSGPLCQLRDGSQVNPAAPKPPPQRDLRLLLVTEYFPPYQGGAERQVQEFAKAFSKRVSDCTVLTTKYGRDNCDVDVGEARVCRLRVLHGGLLRRLSQFAVAFVYVLLNARSWNAVQGHCLSAFVLGATLAAQLRGLLVMMKPCTIGPAGDIAKVRATVPGRMLWRYFLASPVRFVAGSSTTRRDFEAHGIPPGRIVVIPHLLASGGDARDDRPAARRRLDLPERTTVLFVGRFDDSKGLGVLCSAWEASGIGEKVANLVLLGDGPSAEQLRAWADQRPGVWVVGWSPPEPYFRAADVLVFPSRVESYGNVVAEAMAFGLAIVTTRVGMVPDFLRDGESALMVEPEDAVGVAAALRRLIQSEALRRHLGDNGRQAATLLAPQAVLQAHLAAFASRSCATATWR